MFTNLLVYIFFLVAGHLMIQVEKQRQKLIRIDIRKKSLKFGGRTSSILFNKELHIGGLCYRGCNRGQTGLTLCLGMQ